MLRITKPVMRDLLNNNDGFTRQSRFISRDRREERTYTISGGKLFVHEVICSNDPEGSYENDREATEEEARRFLRNYIVELNIPGRCK